MPEEERVPPAPETQKADIDTYKPPKKPPVKPVQTDWRRKLPMEPEK